MLLARAVLYKDRHTGVEDSYEAVAKAPIDFIQQQQQQQQKIKRRRNYYNSNNNRG